MFISGFRHYVERRKEQDDYFWLTVDFEQYFWEVAGAIGLTPKSNRQNKLRLTKTLIHTVSYQTCLKTLKHTVDRMMKMEDDLRFLCDPLTLGGHLVGAELRRTENAVM